MKRSSNLLFIEVELLNIMCTIDQEDYEMAVLLEDNLRKRVQRNRCTDHPRYANIPKAIKFLTRLKFKKEKSRNADPNTLISKVKSKPYQYEYFELDFEQWFWNKVEELGG